MLKIALAVLALLIPAQALAGPAEEQALAGVVRDYDAWVLGDDPVSAGQGGDRAALARWPDVSLAADAARNEFLLGLQDRLRAIDASGLSEDSRLNHAFLRYVIDDRLQGLALDAARLSAFSNDSGFHTLAGYLANTTPINTEADARAYVARLEGLPAYYAANMALAERAAKTGLTQTADTTRLVLAQVRRQVAVAPAADPLLAPLSSMPASIPAPRQAELRARALAAVVRLREQQNAFAAFLETTYLPAARPGLGISSAKGGRAYYRYAVRHFTTTQATPDEIHAVGLSEVARIRAEMEATMREAGFTGTYPEFLAFLRSDPRFYATSRQDLLEKASEIAKRIDDKLPRFFGTLPRLSYGVRPVPADIEDGYTTGRYFPGSLKLGVAGGYMVNTSKLDQRPLYELPALTLHEAVPGHHLQIALAQELEDAPAFRRDADVSAFVEGWGLYSEKLGVEMGIYRDPYERFGRLSYEMWRACRLVADTGIHWKGWTLDQARACFMENSALAPHNIETELARYVSWPGQALSYKTGEMKILALRAKAERALGERFDIRRFHDAVLLAGPLPLDLLEGRIERWIAAEKAR
ncbi:MAG TPA: DUF885 family protein [Caulobacteraceae bacterium]|nr:DUF885 family protein [Caulobacteraceae bacterium]